VSNLTLRPRFALDKRNARIWGVCAGLANWTGIDAMWIRLGFVAGTLLGFGSFAILYLVIGLVANRQA
jgi:phage shock protein PspC (stress-responsive transcriptional regulator)